MKEKYPKLADVLVGRRLRVRRKELGLAQAEVGDAVGVSFQQIQKYEKGWNRLSASRLARLSHFLGVSPNYFLKGLDFEEADIREIAAVLDGAGDPEALRLNIAFMAIRSQTMREAILRFVGDVASGVDPVAEEETAASVSKESLVTSASD